VPVLDIEEAWHGLKPPFLPLFDWLEGRVAKPGCAHAPVFRPVMLSNAIEEADLAGLEVGDLIAEWKWDGIRVQINSAPGWARVYSRSGDDMTPAFPDVTAGFSGRPGVLDGEILVVRDGEVRPFSDLEERLNRKVASPNLIASYPAHVRLYDLLFDGSEDIRPLSLTERRARLDAWIARERPTAASLSEAVPFASWEELRGLWTVARRPGIEGLMLKRRASPYLPGRPPGHWYKWKRSSLTADCVLMYAERGSGKQSSYYSDLTFGAWRSDGSGKDELVPVGRAHPGAIDKELIRLDRWVRRNTIERFGPVRAVAPEVVLEIAFDSIASSTRHKSGIALRSPRLHRIRWGKPALEAVHLETLTP
jgi:DNA ligase-1